MMYCQAHVPDSPNMSLQKRRVSASRRACSPFASGLFQETLFFLPAMHNFTIAIPKSWIRRVQKSYVDYFDPFFWNASAVKVTAAPTLLLFEALFDYMENAYSPYKTQ